MMKKWLFLVLMWLMASAALAIDLPDPVITVIEGDEYYTIDVEIEGDYELCVSCDNVSIETPYAIERLDEDMEYLISAYAQVHDSEGWFYSNVIDLIVFVPAREETPVPGPYPPNWVIIDVTEGDRYYTVSAYCIEDYATASLYSNGEAVDNPYIIERTNEDMEYVIVAVGHCEGYEESETRIVLSVPAFQEPLPGDMNSDGVVNIADVSAVINAILSHNSEMKYDFDGDGEVTILDVTALIVHVLSGR